MPLGTGIWGPLTKTKQIKPELGDKQTHMPALMMPPSFPDAAKSYAWIVRVEYPCPTDPFVNHRALHIVAVNCCRVHED
jgi:hypothetical protein